MGILISRLIKSVDATFGTCSICMRKSFAAGVVALSCYLVVTLIWSDRLLQTVLGLAALGLISIWVLHVATFSARAVYLAQRKRQQAMSSGASTMAQGRYRSSFDRRAALGIFARAAGVAVFASATFWPFIAGATQHVCSDNLECEIGNKCCWNSDSETYFCCASSHVCCVDRYTSYCRNPNIGEYC
tara:strand:- start:581 stop:1141 length:561 start_codon:yes stop_codon:yes gene_type:complete